MPYSCNSHPGLKIRSGNFFNLKWYLVQSQLNIPFFTNLLCRTKTRILTYPNISVRTLIRNLMISLTLWDELLSSIPKLSSNQFFDGGKNRTKLLAKNWSITMLGSYHSRHNLSGFSQVCMNEKSWRLSTSCVEL